MPKPINIDRDQRTVHRVRHRSPEKPLAAKKQLDDFWKSPWTALGALIAVLAIGIPAIKDWQTKRLMVFLSLDSSASALANPADGDSTCRATVPRLMSGDTLYNIPYADTTEVQHNTKVTSPTAIFNYCDDYRDKKKPERLGKSNGTTPVALIDRIFNNIVTERKRGNTQNIVLISYLQEAEPGPNIPPLNFDNLATKLKLIQKERGTVLLIGTSGDLRQKLEQMDAKDPDLNNLRLCSVGEQVCIREAFDMARQQ